jgi:hypothetical protein
MDINELIPQLEHAAKRAISFSKQFVKEDFGKQTLFRFNSGHILGIEDAASAILEDGIPSWVNISPYDIHKNTTYLDLAIADYKVANFEEATVRDYDGFKSFFHIGGPSLPPEFREDTNERFSIKESPGNPKWTPATEYTERLDRMLSCYRTLAQCGNYDSAITGAIGEVYAEEMLGMTKGERGLAGVDGWINDRAVQVKTKEINKNWTSKALSQRYVPISQGREVDVDDLIVILAHPEAIWVHYYGPIAALKPRKTNQGKLRYFLHEMNGEGLASYDKHINRVFPGYLRSKRTSSNKRKSDEKIAKVLEFNRLIIKQSLVGSGTTIRINDYDNSIVYELPHDELVNIIGVSSASSLKSRSWLLDGVYSRPTISKDIRNRLKVWIKSINT